MRKGLDWSIGDGANVRLWHDPWLSFLHPQAPVGPPTTTTNLMKVSNLICSITKEWNTLAIRHTLPQYEDSIRAINPSLHGLRDTLIWLPEKSGVYSTKTCYHIARKASQVDYPLQRHLTGKELFGKSNLLPDSKIHQRTNASWMLLGAQLQKYVARDG